MIDTNDAHSVNEGMFMCFLSTKTIGSGSDRSVILIVWLLVFGLIGIFHFLGQLDLFIDWL